MNAMFTSISIKLALDDKTTIKYEDIAMTNDVFESLTKDQLEVLQEKGILHYILHLTSYNFFNKQTAFNMK